MKRPRIAMFALSLAVAGGAAVATSTLRAADEKSAAAVKKDGAEIPCCPIDPKAQVSLDKLKALAGTWVSTTPAPDGQKPLTITFRATAAGSAVIETMFPGSDHEMVNMYTADGAAVLLTHYCAQGVQPRMRLSSGDGKAMKFDFVDGGNIKSRNEPHMDALTMTIDGDTLTEEWSFYADGKVVDRQTFTFKRQVAAQASR